jgi:hypothetical protein
MDVLNSLLPEATRSQQQSSVSVDANEQAPTATHAGNVAAPPSGGYGKINCSASDTLPPPKTKTAQSMSILRSPSIACRENEIENKVAGWYSESEKQIATVNLSDIIFNNDLIWSSSRS